MQACMYLEYIIFWYLPPPPLFIMEQPSSCPSASLQDLRAASALLLLLANTNSLLQVKLGLLRSMSNVMLKRPSGETNRGSNLSWRML